MTSQKLQKMVPNRMRMAGKGAALGAAVGALAGPLGAAVGGGLGGYLGTRHFQRQKNKNDTTDESAVEPES